MCRFFVTAIVITLFALVPAAPAQTWDGGLSHNNMTLGNLWSIPNNWVGDVPPVSAASTALVFTLSGSQTNANQNIANPFLLNSIVFNGSNFTAISGGPLQFNFNAGTPPFIGQDAATAITISNAIAMTSSGLSIGGVQAGSLLLSGNVTGSGALIIESSGAIILTGNNSYTGGTLMEFGITQAGASGALGTGTLSFLGGTLQYGPGNNTDYSARFVTNQSYIIDTNGQNVTFGSALQGSSGLVRKLGTGTLTLTNAANNYAGGTTVNGGILAVAADGALGAASGGLTLAGGTIEATATFTSARAVTVASASNVSVDSGSVLTLSGAVGGSGALTKIGGGTLILNGLPNVGSGFQANGGTLDFHGVSLQVGFATIGAGAGATIQYDPGTTVVGGFLYGPGTHVVMGGATFTGTTTYNSAVVNVTGPASLTSFTNGGTLNVTAAASNPATFNGLTNQGSGAITVGAASAISVSDFESYGLLTIAPATGATFTQLTNAGASPLYFNGGSRTFIGSPVTSGTFVAGIDLHGQNAEVAGGLFVNNGYVIDSTNSGAAVVADYGALVKGAGFYLNSPITQNGGRVQAGNSPGSASFGQLTFGPGGVSSYVFAIDDAIGTAGPNPNAAGQVSGWGLMKAIRQSVGATMTNGDFAWTADGSNKLDFAIETLVNPTTVGTDVSGLMADFDPTRSYSWPAVTWSGAYSGPTDAVTLDASTIFDTSAFENPIAGAFGWSFDPAGQTLSLTYTPSAVPEPGTVALVGLAAVVGWTRRRRHGANGAA